MNTHTDPLHNPHVAHETGDVDGRAITKFGIALVGSAIIIYFALYFLFDHFTQREKRESPPPSPLAGEAPKAPPEPRLQPSPRIDMREMRAHEDALLNGYGWIDPQKGIVRIPIERAMELVAQRGLPVTKQTGKTQDTRQKKISKTIESIKDRR